MSKVTMPKPEVLYTTTNRDGDPYKISGFTAAQLEAYAAAKVREALEEAAGICDDRINNRWVELSVAAVPNAIRALMPKQPGIKE